MKHPLMKLRSVINYLCKESKWGCKTHKKMKLWDLVKVLSINEIHKALKANEIRFIGRKSNTLILKEINMYWQFSEIKNNKLNKNEKLENILVNSSKPIHSLTVYYDLCISAIYVKKVWSLASFFTKKIVYLIVNRYKSKHDIEKVSYTKLLCNKQMHFIKCFYNRMKWKKNL